MSDGAPADRDDGDVTGRPGPSTDGDGGWPVALRGITESVVTTPTEGSGWNVAALGLHAGDPVTARTWGDTRTRRNFDRDGRGVVQFTRDPVDVVEAALAVREEPRPVLHSADAWVAVSVDRLGAGREGGTEWTDWALEPDEGTVVRRTVPTVNRGFNAVVEATVAASRLGIPAYDDGVLVDRLADLEAVVRRCGGARDRAAFDRLDEFVDWRE